MNVKIAPSLLAADLGCLADEVASAEKGGCDTFHVDIMDWHFVPNLSFGPNIVQTMRRLTSLPLDVHLMVDNPLDMIGPFADAGSDYITLHVETLADVEDGIKNIRDRGVMPGLTLRPDTPLDTLMPYVGDVGLMLVMSVHPGFGGQSFIEESYDRVSQIARGAATANPGLVISVDGGVNCENAGALVAAGANYLVAGTTVFKDHAAVDNMPRLRRAAEGGGCGG